MRPPKSFGWLGGIALVVLLGLPGAPAATKPNIIIIMADDMGFSDIGCYGGEINTPNLDQLAAGGLRFTQFYNTARCCPTRASLLTGLYPHQAAIGHMTGDQHLEGYQGDLSRNAMTIAEVLKPAGYDTYMAGKWHVTRHDGVDGPKDNWPLQRGFDKFYGTIKGGGSFYDPTSLCRGNTFITPDNDPEYKPQRFYYTDAISDNAVKFIRQHSAEHAGEPFFIYVAYTAAHWPMHALPEDIAKYKGKYEAGYGPIRAARFEKSKQLGLIDASWTLSPQAEEWDKVKDKAWEARCMEVYAAMVDRMDQGIGRIVAELKQQNQFDNTLLLFLQDNGGCAEGMGRQSNAEQVKNAKYEPFGPDDLQPQIWPPMQTRDGRPVRTGPGVMPGPEDTFIAYGRGWANVSNTPFREYKHWVHEGGISTPLIAHWPKGIKAKGELCQQPGHLIDLMATCVDVAGAKYPAEFAGHKITPLEGKSLAPAFADRPIKREAIFWEHEGNRAIRVGKWKLVAKGTKGQWELYDMDADRTEMHDLAGEQPERVKELATQWETWAKRAHVVPWPWKPPYGDSSVLVGSMEKVFQLKPGDNLPREQSPQVANRSFKITATIEPTGKDGVIVAQGGSAHGYALYIRDGRVEFALRRDGVLTAITGNNPLPTGEHQLAVNVTKAKMVLRIDGRAVNTAKLSGALTEMPVDGLQVGRDEGGAVGRYTAPNPFAGKIDALRIELSD